MIKFIGKLYDAEDNELDLGIMQSLEKDETACASWFTRQPWRAEVNHIDSTWNVEVKKGTEVIGQYSDPDLFSLIKTVIEYHGR